MSLDTKVQPGDGAQLAGRQSAQSGNFEYISLPENDAMVLRVLKLMPGPEIAPIICMLVFEALPTSDIRVPQESNRRDNQGSGIKPDPPSKFNRAIYEALSYVWGNPHPTNFIPLNGCRFGIILTLEAVLRHLQDLKVERTLWEDAICIDQGNNKEKAREISRMASIYYHAFQVVVWLGEGSSTSELGMSFATWIYQCFKDTEYDNVLKVRPRSVEDEPFLSQMDRGTESQSLRISASPHSRAHG